MAGNPSTRPNSLTGTDSPVGAASNKLIPEWDIHEDEQIVIVGIVGALVLALVLGISALRSGGDDTVSATNLDLTAVEGGIGSADLAIASAATGFGASSSGESEQAVASAPDTTTSTLATTTTVAPTTTATPTTVAPDLSPDVIAALSAAGSAGVSPATDGTITTLTGTVNSEEARATALAAAGSVDGITEVIDNLTVAVPDLNPDVTAALAAAGISTAESTGAEAAGVAASTDGTITTLTGTVNSEEARATAIAAASSVDDITEVIDNLTVAAVEDQLNEALEFAPIQFGSSSADILDVSFATLDSAAELLANAPSGTAYEVQGYTDLAGPANLNLALSQQRADAVVAYLITKGVEPSVLVAKGYGETDQFQAGELAEDYEANRRVWFEPITG